MIIYNVTVKIDYEVRDEWLIWMKEVHIPDVMATGYFTEYKFTRILVEDDGVGENFSIQYTCHNLEDLEAYQTIHAPKLQEEHTKRYKDKFVAFRTLLEEV